MSSCVCCYEVGSRFQKPTEAFAIPEHRTNRANMLSRDSNCASWSVYKTVLPLAIPWHNICRLISSSPSKTWFTILCFYQHSHVSTWLWKSSAAQPSAAATKRVFISYMRAPLLPRANIIFQNLWPLPMTRLKIKIVSYLLFFLCFAQCWLQGYTKHQVIVCFLPYL